MPTETKPRLLRLAAPDETFEVTDAEIGLIEGSPDVRYTLRPLSKAEIDALREKHRGKKEWQPKSRSYEYGEFNQDGYDADMLDLALVGWAGITLRGDDAPCTRDNKLLLDRLRQQLIVTKAATNQLTTAPEEDAASDSFRSAS
jgi:hypothetical protein